MCIMALSVCNKNASDAPAKKNMVDLILQRFIIVVRLSPCGLKGSRLGNAVRCIIVSVGNSEGVRGRVVEICHDISHCERMTFL